MPTRGPLITRAAGTFTPDSIHRPPSASVRSTPLSGLAIPSAWDGQVRDHRLAGNKELRELH
ncbi:MAG: hypothetical protein CVU64_19620 [Deltaproteobacteria bacterium HGW-Deltaproteobacteria-21]|nr:MAG: hypothetical protein CVU64_19620 [Deltaproteobacteria bacterium HGW-Deltaproteobacteria-21]